MTRSLRSLVLPSLLLLLAPPIAAQQPSAAPAPTAPALPIPAVGDMAPDFSFRGVTRYGMLGDPNRVSDYRGQTVVLWFFVRARTRG